MLTRRFARTIKGIGGTDTPLVLLGDSLSVGTGPHLQKLVPGTEVVAKVGASIDWLIGNAAKVNSYNPGMVLIMGGTNDLAGGGDPLAVSNKMRALVTLIKAPVIVGAIPTMKGRESLVREYNDLLDMRFNFANIGNVIAPSELADGVHPGPAGYARMADAWAAAIQNSPSSGIGRTLAISTAGTVIAYFAFRKVL